MESQSIKDARRNAASRPQEANPSTEDRADDPATAGAAPSVPDDSRQLVAGAEKVCAILLANGKTNGRFSMPLSALRRAAAPELDDWGDAVACAIRNNWLRSAGDSVQLTAAGIYVAKNVLDLPR